MKEKFGGSHVGSGGGHSSSGGSHIGSGGGHSSSGDSHVDHGDNHHDGDHNNYIRRGNGYRIYGGSSYGDWDNDWRYPVYVINPVVVNPCPTDYILYNNFTYYNNNNQYTLNNICASADIKNNTEQCKNNGILVITDNSADKKYKCMINP
jgi:hypothetical protein